MSSFTGRSFSQSFVSDELGTPRERGTHLVRSGARPAGGAGVDIQDSAAAAPDEGEQPQFRVCVEGFRSGSASDPVVYLLTVRRGDAVWRVQRRFRQLLEVHTSLVRGFGNSPLRRSLPHPPGKGSIRSAIFGQRDRRFLEDRGIQMQHFLDGLLKLIPCAEQCEALYKFLCYTNLRNWHYGYLIGGGAPPVDEATVARLPKSFGSASLSLPLTLGLTSDSAKDCGGLDWKVEDEAAAVPEKEEKAPSQICVVCQDLMDRTCEADDVRVLPCGHEFHYRCISVWLRQRNTCCVCNGAAVPSAPRFDWPTS